MAGPVEIETLAKPQAYSPDQLDRVCRVAYVLDRGTFVLCEPPERGQGDQPTAD